MLIAHVIHRLDVGGMENGLVNLINHMPSDRYRHAIICLTDATRFEDRIERNDVEVFSLHKRAGHDWGLYVRLWRLFRRLKPDVVHTRNLAALEAVLPAAWAGVPVRIHGEHGRDVEDIDGTKRKYQWLRRVLAPLVHRFIALSQDLESYLLNTVGVPSSKVVRIINGVDVEKFRPAAHRSEAVVIGSVTRMQEVKDPLTLARAFVQLVSDGRAGAVRLAMIGDGPLLPQVAEILRSAGLKEHVWLPGRRDDVAELLRGFDVFSLSSRVEGISNTILEAMATGLPVVATRVGGNAELVEEGVTGALVRSGSPEALAVALATYIDDREIRRAHGRAARARAEHDFAMGSMVSRYMEVYDDLFAGVSRRVTEESSTPCAE